MKSSKSVVFAVVVCLVAALAVRAAIPAEDPTAVHRGPSLAPPQFRGSVRHRAGSARGGARPAHPSCRPVRLGLRPISVDRVVARR